MTVIVYMLTSPSGTRYVGKTKQKLDRRLYQHAQEARLGSGVALAYAIRKYGIQAFAAVVLCECVDDREASACERGLIAQYGTHKNAGGYNLTTGGEGNKGWTPDAATKEKWRQAKLGKKLTPEHRAKISAGTKGKNRGPHSDEKRATNAEAQKKFWADMPADDPRRAAAANRMAGTRSPEMYAEMGKKVSATQRRLNADNPERKQKAVARMLHARAVGIENSETTKAKRAATYQYRMANDLEFREKMLAKQRRAATAHQRSVTYESALKRPMDSWVPYGRVTYRVERHAGVV